MAIRFDVVGDYTVRSATLPSVTAITVAGQMYVVATTTGYGSAWVITDGTNYIRIMVVANSSTLSLNTSGGGANSSANILGTGAWHHVALVRNGTSFIIYVDGTAAITSTLTVSFGTPAAMYFGSDTVGYINGRLADWRIWTASLTQAEVQAEMASATAVKTASLWADYQTPSGATRINDFSGNARHLTAGGTLTDEADPSYGSGATATMTVGTSAAAGQTVTATGGVSVSATVGTASAAGQSVSASGSIIASASLTAGTASAAGNSVSASAGASVSATVGTAAAVGQSITAASSVGASASMTVGAASATGRPVTASGGATSIKLGIIGDSNIDAYQGSDNRGGTYHSVTFNPLEMLVRILGSSIIDPGTWGTYAEPRRTDYAYNWARSAATAGSVNNGGLSDVITQGQHTGLAAQITAGSVDTVFIWVGTNDYSSTLGTYQDVYNGVVSGAALTAKETSIIDNITTALNAVLAAGASRVVLANIGDPGAFAMFQASFPNASYRARVSGSIGRVNAAIDDLVAAHTNVALGNYANLQNDIISDYGLSGGSFSISGNSISFVSMGDDPHNSNLGDGHFGTIVSGIIANLYFLTPLTSLGGSIRLLTDGEIVAEAGLAIAGASATMTVGTASAIGKTLTATAGTSTSATAGSSSASGQNATATAGADVSATAGTSPASGNAVTSTAGTNITLTAGVAASGNTAASTAGASVSATSGGAGAAGLAVSGFSGNMANATIMVGTAAASGNSAASTAGASANLTSGSSSAAGQAVSVFAGNMASATLTVGAASASGQTVTAYAGASVSLTVGGATATGKTVTCDAAGSASASTTAGQATAAGNAVTTAAGVGATLTVGTSQASGQTVYASAGVGASVALTAGIAYAASLPVIVAAGVLALISTGSGNAEGNDVMAHGSNGTVRITRMIFGLKQQSMAFGLKQRSIAFVLKTHTILIPEEE